MNRVSPSHKADIINHLRGGPKTTATLVKLTGRPSAYVSRDCTELRKNGRIIRIDRNGPRGRATYAVKP